MFGIQLKQNKAMVAAVLIDYLPCLCCLLAWIKFIKVVRRRLIDLFTGLFYVIFKMWELKYETTPYSLLYAGNSGVQAPSLP